jgi:hypothetical protein
MTPMEPWVERRGSEIAYPPPVNPLIAAFIWVILGWFNLTKVGSD